jgi:hypothetical protein
MKALGALLRMVMWAMLFWLIVWALAGFASGGMMIFVLSANLSRLIEIYDQQMAQVLAKDQEDEVDPDAAYLTFTKLEKNVFAVDPEQIARNTHLAHLARLKGRG